MNPCPCGDGGEPGACECGDARAACATCAGCRARCSTASTSGSRCSGRGVDELLGGAARRVDAPPSRTRVARGAGAWPRPAACRATPTSRPHRLDELAPLTPGAAGCCAQELERNRLTGRGLHRVRRVARTLADLSGGRATSSTRSSISHGAQHARRSGGMDAGGGGMTGADPAPARGLRRRARRAAEMWPSRLRALLRRRRPADGVGVGRPARAPLAKVLADAERRGRARSPTVRAAARRRRSRARSGQRCTAAGVAVHLLGAAGYPSVLAADREAPAVLFARGDLDALDGRRVADRRHPQRHGHRPRPSRTTSAPASPPPACAWCRAWHAASTAGPTAARCRRRARRRSGSSACGLDVVYPPEHRRLWHDVGRARRCCSPRCRRAPRPRRTASRCATASWPRWPRWSSWSSRGPRAARSSPSTPPSAGPSPSSPCPARRAARPPRAPTACSSTAPRRCSTSTDVLVALGLSHRPAPTVRPRRSGRRRAERRRRRARPLRRRAPRPRTGHRRVRAVRWPTPRWRSPGWRPRAGWCRTGGWFERAPDGPVSAVQAKSEARQWPTPTSGVRYGGRSGLAPRRVRAVAHLGGAGHRGGVPARPRGVRGVGRARRASTGPGRRRPAPAAPLPRLPHHPALRPALHRPCRRPRCGATSPGCGAPARIADDPARGAVGAEGRRPGCRGCCAPTSCTPCSTSRRPRSTPTRRRSGARDDAVLELLYGSGVRVGELCGLDCGDVDLGAAGWSRSGARAAGSAGCRCRRPAADAVDALAAAGPAATVVAGPSRPDAGRRAVPQPARAAGSRPATSAGILDRRARGAHPPARAAPHLRHPPARRRRRPPGRAGAAGPRRPGDDPDLHARQPGAPAGASTTQTHPRA